MQHVESYLLGDYGRAAAIAVDPLDFEGQSQTWRPDDARANALALNHDVAASRKISTRLSLSKIVLIHQLAALDDWGALVQIADEARRNGNLDNGTSEDIRTTADAATLAVIYARVGRLPEAKAILSETPSDCYECLLARALTAETEGERQAADRWYAEAARQGPSLPFAHAEWGRTLLARGDADGAITRLNEAHRRSPHFADPLELWGEALMRKGHYAHAVVKFAEADRYAPRWGHNHMRWGEAQMLAGRYAEARRQYEVANGLDLSRPDRAALNVFLARTASGPLHG